MGISTMVKLQKALMYVDPDEVQAVYVSELYDGIVHLCVRQGDGTLLTGRASSLADAEEAFNEAVEAIDHWRNGGPETKAGRV